MKYPSTHRDPARISRREFIASTAAAGAVVALTPWVHGQDASPATDDLNIGLIGCGAQGRVLINAALKIPGVRFKAVCDIWSYSQRYGSRYLKKFGHEVSVYEDANELFANESDLDAVLVATPDWMHAPHSMAGMNAGLHVYCEKMMSNSLDAARDMVRTSRDTGKLLQIGHQRRSNPRYRHVKEKLLDEAHLLGRLTHANAQWNRGKSEPLGWPEKYEIDAETLAKYGYKDMHELRNWRWFRKYGGGPISDLGAHQIDILNWFFGATPRSVMASGGIDFYTDFEMYDNIMAIYEYDLADGPARAFYQVLTTTSSLGYLERFMGIEGTLAISENPRWNQVFREAYAPEWEMWVEKGYLRKDAPAGEASEDAAVDVRETAPLDAWDIPVELTKAIHQPHLENFFDAVRSGVPLNCPGEIGYQTAVTVMKVNEAVAAGRRLDFAPEEFKV